MIAPIAMIKYFVTPLEIAIHLREHSDLDDEVALKLIDQLSNEVVSAKQVIPDYAYCPKDYEPFPQRPIHTLVKKAFLDVEEKVEGFCQRR